MRPETDYQPIAVYDCLHCGVRIHDPTTTECNQCGTPLVHVGRERDL